MRALIIGGSGFVGRNLAQRLSEGGADVTILDRVPDSRGAFAGSFIEADAQDPKTVRQALDRARPDVVYHLAANSDISAGVADAKLDFGDTLMTTIALAQALAQHPVRQVAFASSSAIFGITNMPVGESIAGFAEPVSWYGKAKLASEYVLEALSAELPETEVLVVRFPNVVGRLATHGVIFDFVHKLRANPSRLNVLGDGHQTKPYVHVAELIDGIEYFRTRLAPGLKRINIGPHDTISVRGIVEEVTSVLEVEPEVTYQDSPYGWPGDVPRYEFDASRMREEGFDLATTSREAVRRAAQDLAVEIPPR